MRGATQCAKRLRQLVRALKSELGNVQPPSTSEPITQLILGVFSRDMPESRAREALNRLRASVVDYNELRVIPPIELTELVDDAVDARAKCEDLSRALNAIFMVEHQVCLDRLASMSKRDTQAYLEAIEGLDGYTRARIRLLGLNQHAVPLDSAMWAYARETRIVDARCPLEEAQRFLERQIPETDGLEFYAMLKKQAWIAMATAVRKAEVQIVRSVPPKREVRNMLQQVAAGQTITAPVKSGASAARPAAGSNGRGHKPPARRTASAKRARRPKPKTPTGARAGRKPAARRTTSRRKAAGKSGRGTKRKSARTRAP